MELRKINEIIISSRNILFNNEVNDTVISSLEEVLICWREIEVDSSRNILKYCIGEALQQIKQSKLTSAGRVLNLIHNLPLSLEGLNNWDLDYFISMELPNFLEHFEEINNSRDISLYVFQQISNQYFNSALLNR
ncbi:hypothetical protein KDK82_2024 [Delftia sp. K82]|uniref:hypothetical protein n=1 Tax=Delftia sp. K82 TaxID=1472718 RepID=UPI000B64A320|nr:hypothetical protein [Delftia sp. K82]OWG18545.1 hypothetical protein KDK82_2024 [Delftia sp. K82]